MNFLWSFLRLECLNFKSRTMWALITWLIWHISHCLEIDRFVITHVNKLWRYSGGRLAGQNRGQSNSPHASWPKSKQIWQSNLSIKNIYLNQKWLSLALWMLDQIATNFLRICDCANYPNIVKKRAHVPITKLLINSLYFTSKSQY